jgi:hypothetical protein
MAHAERIETWNLRFRAAILRSQSERNRGTLSGTSQVTGTTEPSAAGL